jgi:C-terminal processing protease CtpA/Prc
MRSPALSLCLVASSLFAGSLFAQQPASANKEDNALGARLTAIPEVLYAHIPELPRGQGLLVESIKSGSRAAEIGLKAHDIVLAVGTAPVKSGADLQTKLGALPAGEREVLRLVRGGKEFALTVTQPATTETAYTPPKSLFKPGGPPAVSVEIKPLSPGTMEVTLFYLNQSNKMERRALTGSLDSIEVQVGDLAKTGQMPANIHDLVAPALERLRPKQK